MSDLACFSSIMPLQAVAASREDGGIETHQEATMNTSLSNPSPKSLLEMAGVTLPAATLADGVVLVIDAQREYLDGHLPLAGIDAALVEGAQLLARARAAGTPVIHILHRGAGIFFNPEGPGYQPIPSWQAQPGEAVIEKTLANSFAGTRLLDALKSTGRERLIVIGFMTHNCVDSTVRAGVDLGYRSTVVAAATATRDLPDGCGGVVDASTLQRATLVGLTDTLARVVATHEEIKD
jgi:nicotinamidase-related amidase